MRHKMFGVLLLCFLLGAGVTAYSQETRENYRLVFSTFDVSSAGNYAYLRDGIQSMLVSRLAAKDGFEVLDQTITDEQLSTMKDGRLTSGGKDIPPVADFLVEGALYGLKSGLNVQVALYPFALEKEILRFSILTNTPDTLIADIEQLAGEMAQAATGKKAKDSTRQQAIDEAGGTSGFVTAHPEAAFKKSLYSGTIMGTPGSVVQTSALGSKRTLTIPVEMTAMTVADADGDGIGELFVLSESRLELYKVSGKGIDKVAETALPGNIRSHAVNAADLDKDGRLELYISATDGLDISSMIFTWDSANGFRVAAENISWYLRPVLLPGRGWRLAGQKRGSDKIEFVREGVYLLNTDGTSKPSQGERLPLPGKINLFDFVYADVDGDGVAETVAIDQRERMRVYNQANELLWVSERSFGGSKVYLGPSPGDAVNRRDKNQFTVDENADRQLVFVPGRLLVADLDGDGQQEIIVNENTMPAFGFFDKPIVSFFNKLRTYKEGMVVGLAWNGSAMSELWRTGKFRGYIADHAFSVLDKVEAASGHVVVPDRKKTVGRLFVGQIPNSGTFVSLLPGSDDSELTVYDLEFSSEKSK